MDILIICLLSILIIAIAAIAVYVFKTKNSDTGQDKLIILTEKISNINQQNQELRLLLDQKLSETHQVNRQQFSETSKIIQNISSQSQKLISEVTEKLTKLDETNKQVVNFSSQLQNLQDILKNPKQRGILGEYFLEETLKNVLPPNSYQMQYKFKDDVIVDAVVFIKDKVVPIDSKFSLENYEKILNTNNAEQREKLEKLFKQDLKNRIDETSKYIKPSEGTMDFAFMFIPSEAIYYDLLVNKIGATQVNSRDLIEYAFNEKHVIITSPTSFLAYLQTVLQGLRALQIEESAMTIRENVGKLGQHLLSYESFLEKLGNNLSTTVNHYNSAYKEFKKIDKDIAKITDGKSEVDILIIDKPNLD